MAVELSTYKRMFSEALDLNERSRTRATKCNQYYHKRQLTAEEVAALRRRKQPDIIINRVRPAVNGTLGVLQQGQTDPKAWPRNPDDEDSADVATKTLRFIADYNDFDDLRVKSARDYLVKDACAVIVEVDENRRVVVGVVSPDEHFYDPRSRREDFSDARYQGVAKWMYADDVAAQYPDAKEDINNTFDANQQTDEALTDRPEGGQQAWVDTRRRRLLVVEIYHREGKAWNRCVYHAGGILERGESPYKDSDGKPCCPIIAQSCYIDDDNIRYGVVFDMLDLQDEINKRRSKALHLITMRQIRASRSSTEDGEDIRRELAKPDGVVLGEKDDFEILPTNDMAAANLQMMVEAKGEMERTSPNPALMGRDSGGQSGRALQTRQEAGLAELAIVFGGIEAWERRVYRQMWNTAKQFWTAPDYIRVTDDEGAPQFVGINQPIMGPAVPTLDPQTGMATLQPQVLGYENPLAEMNVDIELDSVPDTATLAQEQFAVLGELAKLYGPQEVPFEDMLMLSSIPDKSKIIERRKARQEQQAQAGGMAEQVQAAAAVEEIKNTAADTDLKTANAELARARASNEQLKPHMEAAQMQFNAEQSAQDRAAADIGRFAAGQ